MNAIVCKAKNVRLTHRLAMLTLFLCVFSGAKAQVSEGLYYLGSHGYNVGNTTTNYYLCPTEEWAYYKSESPYYYVYSENCDTTQPFMTTYQCRNNVYDSKKALWVVKQSPTTGYFYVIRLFDGKYLTYNGAMGENSNKGRMRIHLQTTADGDNALFQFTYKSETAGYLFASKNGGPDNANRKYLNVSGNANEGNQPYLYGVNTKNDGPSGLQYVGGIIGLWTDASGNDVNSRWYPESTLLTAPAISDLDQTNNTVTITADYVPVGCQLFYTINEELNASNGDPYTDPISVTGSVIIRAAVVGHGMVLSEVATKEVSTAIPNSPTIEATCDNLLKMSCDISTAHIYYNFTTDGSEPTDPDNTSYEYEYTEPVAMDDNAQIKAVAYNGNYGSGVTFTTFKFNNVAPTLDFNPSNSSEVIVEFLQGQTIHYTTNGQHPDPNDSGESISPYHITGLSDAIDVHVCVITTSTDGRGPSCPVTEIRRPKKPTIKTNDVCNGNGELIQTMELTGITDQDIGAGKTYWYALSNGEGQTAPALNTFTQYTRNSVLSIMDIATAYDWNGSVMVTLHAYAKDAAGNPSVMVSQNYELKHTAAPIIHYEVGVSETTVTITSVTDATIHYTIDGGAPVESETNVNLTFQNGDSGSSHTITAWAQIQGEGESCEVTKIVRMPVPISSLDAINDPNGVYDLSVNINATDFNSSITFTEGFKGSLNGNNHTISNLSVPLFNVINGGTVNNLFFDNVSINITAEGNVNVGTICGKAMGASRIYNCGVLATNSIVTTDEDGYTKITGCSSTISGSSSNSGSSNVGGLVGLLDGSSRVINCFSYANITGGDIVGGIVGYNNYATTSESNKLKTMVMNCMFYGDITGGNSNKAPIYNGVIITNAGSKAVNNFNYFWSEASYVQDKHIDVYNCALAAETRYLQRFEFFRRLLNSNRALAAWWATGDRINKDEMMKWVMEPTQIGTSTPYPILKTHDNYPSVVNYDTINVAAKPRNQGGKLGVLTVNIQMGSGGAIFGPPSGAVINSTTSSLKLPILDKDTAHFNFNYYKVQLPYYNDVGTKNYNDYRVVTGWKIVGITGGTQGSYSTGSDVTFTNGEVTATPYNFADRHCTDKDLYSVSGRVFSQGAYWDVPEGVTAITIQPYWAKAAYVADEYADVVYKTNMSTQYGVPNVGGGRIYRNGENYTIAGSSQIVYTSISNAIASSALSPNTSHTVNDYAVVLVGNCHQVGGIEANKPYTVTSIDLDNDNEPDYALILRFDGRTAFHPLKYDFVSVIGLGMAQKTKDAKGTFNFGIPQPKNWFELTNTSLFWVTQFEYGRNDRAEAPYILQGGVFDQWVSGQGNGNNNKTTYFHVGGNVWFKEFHLGCHQDKSDISTKHPPVSVTGGDFDAFYLTGLYATTINFDDDAECYINGGRFGTMAGTGMEGIGNPTNHNNGNITWLIDNADIKEFFAGGINAAKIAEGNLYTKISNSHVGYFYGGPKFGDMNSGRTVKTTADNCTFGYFFGAGYGGNSYYTAAPGNFTNDNDPWKNNTDEKLFNLDWDKWVRGEIKPTLNGGNYSNGVVYNGYDLDYIEAFGGVSTSIDYQFLPHSNNQKNVGRLFLKFVKFSLATTRSVTSTLTGCTIENNFYGGGSLGKVEGEVVSTLDGCTVRGDVFGAGYSATIPTVPVMDRGGFKDNDVCQDEDYPCNQPYYDKELGVFFPGKFTNTVDYKWEYDPDEHPVTNTATAVDPDRHILYTLVDLDKRELGSVKGNVTLTVKGNSMVFGSVFGGGEESLVVKPENTDKGNTEVQILGKTKVFGNIYGGGNMGEVEGNTKVIVNSDN